MSGRQDLAERLAAWQEHFGDEEVPLPPFWGGYRVVPERFEFWASRPSRLHDRFCYTARGDGTWSLVQLAP